MDRSNDMCLINAALELAYMQLNGLNTGAAYMCVCNRRIGDRILSQ